nr:uncharacterized mitochondrial protein AtMg00810-like [Tanacetum cinerariifolium]
MFDGYFNPPTIVVSPVQADATPRAEVLADSPMSISISQDAPSTRSSSNVIQIHTPFEHLGRWTKDHPIANVIGDPSRSSKYASQIVKKYGLNSTDSVDIPMIKNKKLDEDLQGKLVDATLYHGMIGSLVYLTASGPDLSYVVCLCAPYQAKPTEKHLQAMKRIFRYLNRTICMGLWYSKDTDMSLTAYADADHVENGIVELYFVWTEYQLADIFTKPLPRERFNFLIDKLGMKSMSLDTLKRLAEETDD